MAAPARRTAEESPPLDPSAVARAYELERARRKARADRDRARRRANVRFAVTILVLLTLALVLAGTAWREIQRVFGL